MVLQQQKLSAYNITMGRRQTTLTNVFGKTKSAPSPNSTATLSPLRSPEKRAPTSNRPSKRRRVSGQENEDVASNLEPKFADSRSDEEDNDGLPIIVPHSPRTRPLDVPNSDGSDLEWERPMRQQQHAANDDIDDNDIPPSSQPTDIEQALPPIKTDKEAIAEYETMRASERAANLQERLGSRKWIEGKSSIYVDAFNLALETVLDEESHLFDEAERQVFADWKELDYEAQYLYVRLFLRKTAAWFRIKKLGYYSDIGNMEKAIGELYKVRPLPKTTSHDQVTPGEWEPPEGTVLEGSFTFADCSDEHITTVEEASTLLLLDELKVIAKDARVQGKNKSELLRALRRTSGKQTGLGFANLRRSETEETVQSNISESGREESPMGNTKNRDEYYLRKIMAETGQCIRLSPAAQRLFERVHLVFYRSTEWTEKSLTTIILARIARRNFPEYIVSRSSNIFPSGALLLEFEASLRTQFRVDSILEFNGTPKKDGFEEILSIFEAVLPRWRVLLAEEQKREDSIYVSGEGAYLRRLSPAWVYTRLIHKGAGVLGIGKFKQHLREHSVLCELLNQRLFHAARRGAWYQRKALLEEHYMASLTSDEGRTGEQQKKHWKKIALQTCEEGLQDNLVHLIYHHDLQKRVKKLERQLKIPKRLQHEFGHALLSKPTERTFRGVRIERYSRSRRASSTGLANGNNNNAGGNGNGGSGGGGNSGGMSTKTMWLDPPSHSSLSTSTTADASTEKIVSVEAFALSNYRLSANGSWKGFHTEGGILRTLFALLFYDVLFLYLPNVFQTPYQTCPLDLHTDAFYPSRLSEINAQLARISNGEAEQIVRDIWQREGERKTCVVGLDWGFELQDLCEIVTAFKGERLSAVMRVMCQEYAERGGGVPDLFLWRTGRGKVDPGNDEIKDEVDEERAQQGQDEHVRDSHNHNNDIYEDTRCNDYDDYHDDQEKGTETGEEEEKEPDILFAEVKSENDRLSDTQRLWIHVLMDAGINVELCNVLASEVRVLE